VLVLVAARREPGRTVLVLDRSARPFEDGGDEDERPMTEERFSPGRCTFVYSPDYYCDIGPHVFPTVKYRLVHRALLDDGDIPAERFLAPEAASREDLLLAHTEEYVRDLLAFRRTARTRSSELPINGPIIRANLLGTGGTIFCCRRALSEGLAMNLAGGFHHAFPDHAEGFCYINDIAVAIRRLRADGRDERVIGNCLRRRIPVAAVLGGGYARNTQDTVRAHHATCRAMWEAGKQIANCRHARRSPAPGGSPLWRAEKTGRRRIAE
jgi:acetoin utilization deacetylase AcuC-like enzyme